MPRHKGTIVVFPDGQRVIFPKQLSERQARQEAIRIRRSKQNPVQDPVGEAVEKYEEFNFKAPRELVRLKVDLKTPLIRIGAVPEIHYISDKEGKATHYVHFVKRPGTLYGHPSGKMFMLLGGSTRIDDWLRENPKDRRLSWKNIERARQQYKRLSEGAKRRIDNVKSYIMKIAWQMQRGKK